MGGVVRTFKKAAKQATKGLGDIIEIGIEKPVKKIGKEKFDILTGSTDEERRALLYGEFPEPEYTPEVTPEIVPDDETILGKRRRTKYAKKLGGAGTIMEEYGVAYAKPIDKAPTGGV